MSVKQRPLKLIQKPNQSKDEAIAEKLLQPSSLSAAVIDVYKTNVQGDSVDFPLAVQILEQEVEKLKSGDLTKVEEMLLSQAVALEMMFVSMARRAKAQEQLLQYETHMRFALKAQNQSRATLQALVQLKQPSQTTFVKQTNIAQGHQQVNNLAGKNITPQNELLRDSYAELDAETTTTPTGADTTLETMGKINRSKNTRRKNKVINECHEGWQELRDKGVN
jgi:hypothetical protein